MSGRDEIASIEMTHIDSPYNFVLMIPQSDTERLLEEHLGTFGAKTERQVELKQFQSSPDAVSCSLLHSNGKEETAEASWLIGCDGTTARYDINLEWNSMAVRC